MTATAIRATGLRKSYGDTLVLDGIDLEVATGSVFALLGPNGAGKTTTVHMLTTMLTPDAGRGRSRWTRPADRSGGGALRDRRHRPVLGGRQPPHRPGEPPAHGRSQPSAARGGPAPHRRPARPIRPRRGGRPDGRDLFRRQEAPARPGDDARRRSADRLPRRADDRARPARTPHDVGHRSSPRGRRHHDLPDHPVPRGGR